MEEVRALVVVLRDRSRHELRNEDDYIAAPKPDGYRSHHLMMGFRGRGEKEIYNGIGLKFKFALGCSILGRLLLKQ